MEFVSAWGGRSRIRQSWHVAALTGIFLAVFGPPFLLLQTGQARQEFGAEKWQYSLRTFFVVTTIVALITAAIGGLQRFHDVQVRRVRAVLAEYSQIDRVWVSTNDDVELEIEAIYFTVRGNNPDATYAIDGCDGASKAELRELLDRALRERREVECPDYATPFER
jgi:hypothetical protein